ncbi:MAG: helix-turn-helix transcriptional regulator [Sphingobacteriales bacterium]|nr:helix-turn-helix transcriptional regulator [Sphingobacteriales bacterium]
MDKNTIAHIIQERRDYLLLKQEDLAEMTGVTSKTIYLIESGKGNPSLDTLQKILEVLGLSLSVQIKKTAE